MMRLQKYLAHAGVASRRQAEELITAGKIKVNKVVVRELGTLVDETADVVEYNKKVVTVGAPAIYIALHKPVGYISSATSDQGKSVMELIPAGERVYPVGRLDKDSSGLLLLSNDGDFANQIMHPSAHIEKEYIVELDQHLKLADAEQLTRGFKLAGQRLRPVQILDRAGKHVRLILRQGVNRQIRRMFGRLGYTVISLQRVRVGRLELGTLKPGASRRVELADIIG